MDSPERHSDNATAQWLPTGVDIEDVTGPVSTQYASPSTQKSPWVSPAPTGDIGLWLRDVITCMGPWAGLVLGGACALVLIGTLYGLWLCRRRRRSAKVRRHVTLMQASDASLHTIPGSCGWSSGAQPFAYDVPVPSPVRLGSPMGARPSQTFPQLISSRPRLASYDGANAGSGITLRAEVLDPSYYSGTIKRKTRMNGDLAQAIAAFGLPAGRLSTLRAARKGGSEDTQDLPSNMEVVYQERTAV